MPRSSTYLRPVSLRSTSVTDVLIFMSRVFLGFFPFYPIRSIPCVGSPSSWVVTPFMVAVKSITTTTTKTTIVTTATTTPTIGIISFFRIFYIRCIYLRKCFGSRGSGIVVFNEEFIISLRYYKRHSEFREPRIPTISILFL